MTEAVIKELEAKHDAAYAKWRRRINEWEEECGDPGLIANALEDLIDAKIALELAHERRRVDAEIASLRNSISRIAAGRDEGWA